MKSITETQKDIIKSGNRYFSAEAEALSKTITEADQSYSILKK